MFNVRSKQAARSLAMFLAWSGAAVAAPELGKTFSAVNTVSRHARVQVTLSNPDGETSRLTAALTDTLPAGLRVSNPARASSTCVGGGLDVQPAAVTLASGATIPPAGVCTFGFDVDADAPGDYENVIAAGALQTTTGTNSQPAVATLNLPVTASEIGLAKRFAPTSIAPGGVSRLIVTLWNSGEETTTSADIVDALPDGLVVAAPPNASTNCNNGSVVTTSNSVTLASGAGTQPFNGLGTCSFGVDVTAPAPGIYTNVIPAGALQTPNGNSPTAAVATLSVAEAGPRNGASAHGPYDVGIGFDVTAIDLVAGTATDLFNANGAFDIGFTVVVGSGYNAVLQPGNEGTIAVDEHGRAAVMRIGDTVGPDLVFAEPNRIDPNVLMANEWQDGTNAFVGVRFACDGRLRHPVPRRYCYGYVHIASDVGRVVETAFDGDGDPIVIARGVGLNAPALSIAPNRLDLHASADGAAYGKVTVRNRNGSDPLTFTAGLRQTRRAGEPQLLAAGAVGLPGPVPTPQASAPWIAAGGVIAFVVDDGSIDSVIGHGVEIPEFDWSFSFGAVYLNQFAATGPLTIDTISAYWPGTDVTGVPTRMTTGLPVKLVVFYDPASTGNPTNAVRVTADEIVTIDVLDGVQNYPVHVRIPGPGDVYIGFVSHWANVGGGARPFIAVAALDTTVPQGRSWVSVIRTDGIFGDVVDDRRLGNNPKTVPISELGRFGNYMIRATAVAGGVGGLCSGPIVDWLRATPTSGSIDGGGSADVMVRADPASLPVGVHNAELCFTSNDPDDPVFWVPIALTVRPAGSPACTTGDTIFCDGYEKPSAATIISRIVDQLVDELGPGSSLDFVKGEFGVDTPSDRIGKDLHIFQGFLSPPISIEWITDGVPSDFAGQVGGVVDAPGSTSYAALRPGDTVGPDSPISNWSTTDLSAFGAGGPFYLGVRFYNEERQAMNYGYLHLEMSPDGFPARVLDYAYDWDGRPIVIPAGR